MVAKWSMLRKPRARLFTFWMTLLTSGLAPMYWTVS